MAIEIFISYRRDDSQAEANLTYVMLQQEFGRNVVFMDQSAIRPGDRWPNKIRDALREAKVIIVLIKNLGKWLGVKQETGHRRIEDEDDWVRQEIEAALTGYRDNGKIILSLVSNDVVLPLDNHNHLPDYVIELFKFQHLSIDWGDLEKTREVILKNCKQRVTTTRSRDSIVDYNERYGAFAKLAKVLVESNSNQQFRDSIENNKSEYSRFIYNVIPVKQTKELHDIAQDVQVDALGSFNRKMMGSITGDLELEFLDEHDLIQKTLKDVKQLQNSLMESSLDKQWIRDFINGLSRLDTAIRSDNGQLFKENVCTLNSLLKKQQANLNNRLVLLVKDDLVLEEIEKNLVNAINLSAQGSREQNGEVIKQACTVLKVFVEEFLRFGRAHDNWQKIDNQLFHLEMLLSARNPALDMDDVIETLESVEYSLDETIGLKEPTGLSKMVQRMRQNLDILKDKLNQLGEDSLGSRDLELSLIKFSDPARKIFRGVDRSLHEQCNDLLKLRDIVHGLLQSPENHQHSA